MVEQPERLKDVAADEKSAGKFWAEQIRKAGEAERDWRKEAEKIQRRYRNEEPSGKKRYRTGFPIFWSNVQVLKPNVYSQTPRPDVRRRAVHEDPLRKELGRQAAIVVENGLTYEIDNAAFGQAMEAARDDMLVVGRGVVREVYAADTVRKPLQTAIDPMTGMPVHMLDGMMTMPDGFANEKKQLGPYVDAIENERTESRFVFWADYRQSPARCWSDVTWVAFRHAMDNDELAAEFPKHDPKKIPKVISANDDKATAAKVSDMPADPESPFARAEVWEIWSKGTKERIWIATNYDEHVLRRDPDPMRLSGFFPCPRPIYAVPTTDTLVPMPELHVYESLADELDEIQDRLRKLVKVAKFIGLTDGDFEEMANLSTMTDGDFRPIRRPEVIAGDLRGAIWHWPLGEIVQAISILRIQSQDLRDSIYELTGISDLRRGIGQERESATAQRLKASYGAARMTPRSQPMAEFVRDLMRIKAEIMVEHFSPESLQMVSGQQIAPEVLAFLKEERFRNTTIDIETDSTVAPDEEAEKAEANEYLNAAATFLTAAVPLAVGAPMTAPLLMAMLRAASRAYKFSREVEEQLDALAEQMQEPESEPVGPEGPPPPGNGAMPQGMVQ